MKDDPSIEVRKSAVFGVSQSRESGAFDVLANLARTDPEPRVRSEAIFWIAQKNDNARRRESSCRRSRRTPHPRCGRRRCSRLSQLKDDAGVAALINVREDERRRRERGAKRSSGSARRPAPRPPARSPTASTTIPNTEVKKKAVFALSQLPKDEGVPLLINVARTNANPEVRKQAMFWLGQSKDPRALAFFEEVLTGK